MKVSLYLSLGLTLVLSAASCGVVSGLVNGAGRVLDGSVFDEKTINTYTSTDKSLTFRLFSTKDGERRSVFVLNRLPFLQFYGTAPDETGLFFITRVHFLYSSVGGWLEGDIGASGTGIIVEADSRSAEFSLENSVVLTEIIRGGIRRYDERLLGDRALTELRSRGERIRLVTAWMKEQYPPAAQPETQHDFESYWGPILLPETVGKNRHPSPYAELYATQNDVYAYGEDIRWNTAYTRELFPEHLRQFRDSGSLLRDWEEAASWFYIIYYWDIMVRDLCEKHYLHI
jgi:hypothetical protein